MKYAIVENEFHSLTHIREMLANLRPDWTLLFTSDSVEDTVARMREVGMPDLMFLDIDLNDGNCFRLFDIVKEPVPVIFTTAYDEFMLKAFKVHSIDYLLKPITTDDLLFAIRKFENLRSCRLIDAETANEVRTQANHSQEASLRILIPSKDGYRFVGIDEIAWIESDLKCVILVDKDGAEHVTTFSSLSDIEELLSQQRFFRISRSVIASIDSISEVKKTFNYRLKVRLVAGSTDRTVEVSTSKKKEFLNWLGCNKA